MEEIDTNPVLFDCSKHQSLSISEQSSLFMQKPADFGGPLVSTRNLQSTAATL